MNSRNSETDYRWYVLILAALTHTFTVAMPVMCLPVLFKEISEDLNLSLVQIGVIWGIGAMPSIVTSLLGLTGMGFLGVQNLGFAAKSLISPCFGRLTPTAKSRFCTPLSPLFGGLSKTHTCKAC